MSEAFPTLILVLVVTAVVISCVQLALPLDSTWPQRSPFVGGGTIDSHAWSRYHARYMPMTLVFVAFEMEMMFMYPWAVVYVQEGAKALTEMGMFLALLSLGLIYAWREGAFRWQ